MDLYHGDCLEVMRQLPDASVDAVIADPPYGTTACKWDAVIPFAPMWAELRRVTKPNAAIVLFASQPFTSALVMSNRTQFKYAWVWNKNNAAGFATVKYRPFVITEDVCVFGDGRVNYYPQMETRGLPRNKSGYGKSDNYGITPSKGQHNNVYFPKNLLDYGNANQQGKVHPTQKPVDLLAYLVRTYTNPGETVLDFTMGSGTTGVACQQEGREFIGIELDAGYFAIASERIVSAAQKVV